MMAPSPPFSEKSLVFPMFYEASQATTSPYFFRGFPTLIPRLGRRIKGKFTYSLPVDFLLEAPQ